MSIYVFIMGFIFLWAMAFFGIANPAPSRNAKARLKLQHSLKFIPEALRPSQVSISTFLDEEQPGNLMTKALTDRPMKLMQMVGGILGNWGEGRGDLVEGVSCDVCKLFIANFQHLVSTNASLEDIEDTFTNICSLFKIETHRVCSGLAALFSPEIFTVLDKLILSPDEVCGIFISSCDSPYNPYNNWNITLPNVPKPPIQPLIPPKKGAPTWRVLQLTDIHVDTAYKSGSVAECEEPLCCREGNGGDKGAWKFGDYRKCDTPLETLENMLAHLSTQKEHIDYIIWTGDIPSHNVWSQSREDQLKTLSQAVDLMLKYFPKIPVYPSLGNHESSPVNSFPPNYIKGDNSIQWLYEPLAAHWEKWLPPASLATVKAGAYYTVSPYPGFRIISLNMNYCNNENWWMLLNTTDPNGELGWLINTLQQAENNKEKVHIIGHIPPGISDCLKRWSWNFYKIVNRYENTIVAQFYGHTHSDSFSVFYDEETLKRPISVAYVGPSVTPYSQQNMGYRFYTVDAYHHGENSTFQVLDHETHYLNLTKANLEGKITWEFEYSAKAAYKLTNLFPKDWDDLITRMKTNQTLMNMYHRFYLKSRHTDSCDAACRKKLLCEARSGRSGDPSFCSDL